MRYEKGTKLYWYSESLGLVMLRYVKSENGKHFVRDERGTIQQISNSSLDEYSTDENHAQMVFFKRHNQKLQSKIDKYVQTLDSIKREKEMLFNKYMYLKDLFPEEFI